MNDRPPEFREKTVVIVVYSSVDFLCSCGGGREINPFFFFFLLVIVVRLACHHLYLQKEGTSISSSLCGTKIVLMK